MICYVFRIKTFYSKSFSITTHNYPYDIFNSILKIFKNKITSASAFVDKEALWDMSDVYNQSRKMAKNHTY